MAFMQPQAQEMSAYRIETMMGAEMVPAFLVGDNPSTADLRQYVEGEPLEGAEPESEHGWYSRFSAPGYTDQTDWMGPFPSEARALLELADQHMTCVLCWEGSCWDGPEPCAEDDVETESERLEALAIAAKPDDDDDDPTTYKVIRFYQDERERRTLSTGHTLAEVQAHCKDTETNSKTCTDPSAESGVWFDGWTEE